MSQFHFAVTFVDQSNPKELVYKIDFKVRSWSALNEMKLKFPQDDAGAIQKQRPLESRAKWLRFPVASQGTETIESRLRDSAAAFDRRGEFCGAFRVCGCRETPGSIVGVFEATGFASDSLAESDFAALFGDWTSGKEKLLLYTGFWAGLIACLQFAPYAMSKVKSQGFLSKMAKSVKTTREIDPWFEHQKSDVQSLNNVMAIALRCLEKVCKAQKSLATSMTEAANKYADFGNEEPNIQLASNLKKFATILEKSGNTFKFMADTEAIQLGEFLNNQLNYCHAIDYTMDSRANALQSYEEACKSTLKRKQASDKLKVASVLRHDKVDASLSELTDARNAESEAKELVKKISDAIRERELPLITKQRNVDFCEALRLYARAQCEMELRQKKDWESIVADLQKVDTHLVQHRQLAEKIEAQVL